MTPGDIVRPWGAVTKVYDERPTDGVIDLWTIEPSQHVADRKLGVVLAKQTVRTRDYAEFFFCLVLWTNGILGWSRTTSLRHA